MRAIWHDGQFTYLKSDAAELAGALRDEGRQAGRRELPGPGQRHYVVPKVLERGYLALGDARFSVRAAGAVSDGRPAERSRHGASHRPSPCAARRPAAGRPDVADGGARLSGCCCIIFLTGKPEAPPRGAPVSRRRRRRPSADRVRDYQERLRDRSTSRRPGRLAKQLRRSDDTAALVWTTTCRRSAQVGSAGRRATAPGLREPVRQQRRPEPASRGSASRRRPAKHRRRRATCRGLPGAVDRRHRRRRRAGDHPQRRRRGTAADPPRTSHRQIACPAPRQSRPRRDTAQSVRLGPLHRVLEGTVIDAVLTNRLDGGTAAPVNCLVTNPVYSHSGQHVLIPAGARVLGETRPVQTLRRNTARSRVSSAPDARRQHSPARPVSRAQPDRRLGSAGSSEPPLLVDIRRGGRGRSGRAVCRSFWAAPAFGSGDGDRTVVIAGSAADATAQASAQVMNRFLNRLPTITIREGHRVKVYITSDLDLPEWSPFRSADTSQRR